MNMFNDAFLFRLHIDEEEINYQYIVDLRSKQDGYNELKIKDVDIDNSCIIIRINS